MAKKKIRGIYIFATCNTDGKYIGIIPVDPNKIEGITYIGEEGEMIGCCKLKDIKFHFISGISIKSNSAGDIDYSKHVVQSLKEGTIVKFELKDISAREMAQATNHSEKAIESFNGKNFKIESLDCYGELGMKDYEYYNIVNDDGTEIVAVSGYHLTPIE